MLMADLGKSSFDQLIQAAKAMFCNRDLEKERGKGRRHSEMLAAMNVSTSRKKQKQKQETHGAATTVGSQAILGGSALKPKT